ncbi:MAG: YkgJ family cysteine cluster protein [Nanoarchaeota archaeon]|nr:YkgJ family cysteine cluster protein [Nanoarchaeota archaeon]
MAESYCSKCMKGLYGSLDCCKSPFINYPGFLITLSDAARIVKNTNYSLNDFARIIHVSDEDMKGDDEAYFKELVFNNKFLYLYGERKCPFRGRDGCKIYEHRPMMCRLFPFWFKKKAAGVFDIFIDWGSSAKDEQCLICRKHFKSEDTGFLLSLINETEDSMMKTIKQFNEEIELHKKLKHELENKKLKEVIDENF